MIEIIKSAKGLPAEWDEAIGGNAALKKENLILLEEINPCQQEYILFRDKKIYAVLVKYVLKIDIFCYSKLRLYLPITIIGIPCSVAEPGYHFVGDMSTGVVEYISELKGAKLILNASGDLDMPGFTKGYTLPDCKLNIRWRSFEEYLQGLRSHYRYRYKKALEKAAALSVEMLAGEFDSKLYHLYEQVYDKSAYKLEKLPIDFFRQAEADIAVFKQEGEPIAFVQYQIHDKKLNFLFGGLDYSMNQRYDLYQNMLLYLVRVAIEKDCTILDLGQTAEEMKCRLGAVQEEKYLYIHYNNRVINWFIKKFSRIFSYRIPELNLKVFKENQ